MDCDKKISDNFVQHAEALNAVAFPISTQVPLVTAHPVWSRFWSFEVIISMCAKIWEVSWKPPMDCDIQKIKLFGIVILFFSIFWGKLKFFCQFFGKKLLFWYKTLKWRSQFRNWCLLSELINNQKVVRKCM